MRCPNCGQENRAIARFCQQCGASLPSDETLVEMADEQIVSLSGQAEPVQREEGEDVLPDQECTGPGREEVAVSQPCEPADEDLVVEPEGDGAAPSALTTVAQVAGPAPGDAGDAEPDITIGPTEALPADGGEAEPVIDVVSTEAQVPGLEPLPGGEADRSCEAVAETGKESEGYAMEPRETEGPVESEGAERADAERTDVQDLVDAGLLPWQADQASQAAWEPGTIVHERYKIVEVLYAHEQEVLYKVRDLWRCARCGFAGNSPDEAFCAECGASQDQKPVAMLLQRPQDQSECDVDAEIDDQFVEDEYCYWSWRELQKTGPLGGSDEPAHLVVGYRSDTGQVRALDEDTTLALTLSYTKASTSGQLALFVVADGMGGHEAGEVASQVAIHALAQVVLQNVFVPELVGRSLAPEEIDGWLRQAVETANDQVYLERQKRENDMGTTVTAALLDDWTLHLAHVGDCRAYRWNEDGLQQLTMDHSIVAGMIAAGTVQPQEIYTHPQRSVIYRCVGDRPTVDVDLVSLVLNPGDRLILCCDGLWEMIRNEGIEDVMLRESDPQTACDIMVEQANLAGGTDNISVIVVQV